MLKEIVFLGAIILLPCSALAANLQNHKIFKAGIGTVMGRDPSSMTVSNIEGPIIGVSYIRKNDGPKWSYKCKVDGNKIVWGNSDGRWRESSEDSVITYKLTGNSIVVSETYLDGSKNIKSYKITILDGE